MARTWFVIISTILISLIGGIGCLYPQAWLSFLLVIPLVALGTYDMLQDKKAVLKNWPLVGRFRYVFEAIRPEIQQYFVESDTSGRPFNRLQRSLIYQRAKGVRDTIPFGTMENVYDSGYEWVNHSLSPTHPDLESLRITVGTDQCQQPYSLSLFNISAMSFGALSKNAILSLSKGAKEGNFAHNTGEGGISPYHLEGGADLIWQIGTGYFGCRDEQGNFCPTSFQEKATLENVKMIEVKLSQGAKPGHGGILPAKKLTPEIAEIRGVSLGKDVLSPPAHSRFSTPIELLEFVAQLRELSGGKPVGFKLCIGKHREFLSIVKAMHQTGIIPDFIAVDGGEGGTGAAPLEFSNHIGTPLIDGLIFVHNVLVGYNFRNSIKILASGRVTSAFEMIKLLAVGADACYSARAMMMALGCIQALKCNSNECPVGVATQDPGLMVGLSVADKYQRVARFHEGMMFHAGEMLGAMGLNNTSELRPWHIIRRTGLSESRDYHQLYEFFEPGSLLQDSVPESIKDAFQASKADTFQRC